MEVEHGAILEGYTVSAKVFGSGWSEALGCEIDLFECPLCHDYSFVVRGESLHYHGCGALMVLSRPRTRPL